MKPLCMGFMFFCSSNNLYELFWVLWTNKVKYALYQFIFWIWLSLLWEICWCLLICWFFSSYKNVFQNDKPKNQEHHTVSLHTKVHLQTIFSLPNTFIITFPIVILTVPVFTDVITNICFTTEISIFFVYEVRAKWTGSFRC